MMGVVTRFKLPVRLCMMRFSCRLRCLIDSSDSPCSKSSARVLVSLYNSGSAVREAEYSCCVIFAFMYLILARLVAKVNSFV